MNLNRLLKFVPIGFFTLLLFNCSSVKSLNDYYVISYEPNIDKIKAYQNISYPLPYKIEIQDLDINRIYDRNSIVTRESLHRMSFDVKNKWALRPNKSIVELLVNHILKSKMFKDCKNSYLDVEPDLYITGRINNIEQYKNDKFHFAHINIDLYLRDKNRNILLNYKINRQENISSENTSFLVKTLSDILKEEFTGFINEISYYFYKKIRTNNV